MDAIGKMIIAHFEHSICSEQKLDGGSVVLVYIYCLFGQHTAVITAVM